ncbi:MAG TPA: hypothetical protein VK430_06790 [Xanthobacteraceae bacterium]|nr:hypothetical protein [Xanthobacteraceae bacterium]
MTSEPDSTPRRRPPTIDLTAKEVESEKPASTAEAEAATPPGDSPADKNASGERARWNFAETLASLGRRVTRAHALGAVAGATAGVLVMLAIFAALWIADLVPSPGGAAPSSGERSQATAAGDISARLDKIEAALAAPRPDATLSKQMAAAEAETKSLGDSLAALDRRVDRVAVTAASALAHADAASAAADAAKSAAQQAGVAHGDLGTLASRMAALEGAVQALAEKLARRPASADDRAARLTVAAAALRAAVERGVPYQAELAAVKTLGVEENALAPLAPFAADGIPSASVLARELGALTPALLHASGAAPSESSFLGRLQANAQKLVRIRPIDAPQGDDPAAVVARLEADAARADIEAARVDLARLPDGARALADGWVKKADTREAAIAASRHIAADALAALGKPATQ